MSKKFSIFISFVTLFFSLMIFGSFVFSSGGVLDTFMKEAELKKLRANIEKVKEDNKRKAQIIHMIKNDKGFRESLVKGLGINISEGEYVFRFPQSEKYLGNDFSKKNDKDYTHDFIYLIFIVSLFFIFIQVFVIFMIITK